MFLVHDSFNISLIPRASRRSSHSNCVGSHSFLSITRNPISSFPNLHEISLKQELIRAVSSGNLNFENGGGRGELKQFSLDLFVVGVRLMIWWILGIWRSGEGLVFCGWKFGVDVVVGHVVEVQWLSCLDYGRGRSLVCLMMWFVVGLVLVQNPCGSIRFSEGMLNVWNNNTSDNQVRDVSITFFASDFPVLIFQLGKVWRWTT
ncbi:hypothetical protein Droror1_Dr00014669 [Drosera rotundifolia]